MAVELAVEVAVEFQSGSRKKSGCRKTPHQLKAIIGGTRLRWPVKWCSKMLLEDHFTILKYDKRNPKSHLEMRNR